MKIEKNIPMPPSKRGGPRKYPFADMSVGESAFFENQPAGSLSNPSVAAAQWGARNGRKFSARSIDGGVRIWRVE